jgi:hypothetical protein
LAVAVLPANRPEEEAAPSLVVDIKAQGLEIGELYIDRGYINAPIVDEIRARRGLIVCRPWIAKNGEHFSKNAFEINMRDRTITCPAGEQQRFTLDSTVEFPAATCHACPLRAKCTDAGPAGAARSPSQRMSRSSINSGSARLRHQASDNFANGSQSNTAKHTRVAAKVVELATSVLVRMSLTSAERAPSVTSRSFLAGLTPLPPPRCPPAGPRNHGDFKPVGALEVRGSIPLGSTGKPKGLAAMRGPSAFRPDAQSGCGTVAERSAYVT